jgi:uncharacterized protein DUF3887
MELLASLLFTTFFAVPAARGVQSPIESAAREMVVNMNAGRFEAATKDFSEKLRTTVPASMLEAIQTQIVAQVGRFQFVSAAHQQSEDGSRVIELMSRYEKAPVSIRVVFDVSNHISTIHFDPILPIPVDPALEAIARDLLTNFAAKRFEAAAKNFNADLAKQLTPSAMATLAKNVTDKYGAFRSVNEIHQRLEQSYRVIDLISTYGVSTVAVSVVFDADGRVAGVRVAPLAK